MKFFLDSAMTDEIVYALDTFDIDGVTTNPRHVQVIWKTIYDSDQRDRKISGGY